jgi:signal transduction histidine kinase
VNNAVRHGHARRCRVRLSAADAGLVVEVRDDGSGIDPDAPPGIGLQSMHERAAELGGRLEVRSSPGGTTVRAELPLEVP